MDISRNLFLPCLIRLYFQGRDLISNLVWIWSQVYQEMCSPGAHFLVDVLPQGAHLLVNLLPHSDMCSPVCFVLSF